ncbi:MAG: T9SS type A sorting domain-containing protein [Bacteroidales bacterium]|jgi:hypothetical protein
MKKLLIIIALISLTSFTNAQTYKTTNLNGVNSVSDKPLDEMVFTPAGQVAKSKAHFVDGKHHLNIKDGLVQVIDTKTGAVSQEFDNNAISNLNSKITAADTDNGWVTDAMWHHTGSTPITYFNTNWIVPNPPATSSYQTIFLFNAVVDTLHGSTGTYYILQPVLQWGQSSAGGGNYWSITNWCVCLTNWNVTAVYYGSLIPVSPGTNLQGLITLTSDTGSAFNYNSAFTEYPDSALQVNHLKRADWAYETLEVYNLIGCNEYPSDTVIKMTDIEIKTDSVYPSLSWIPQNLIYEYGQHTNIVSNSSSGGEVDIYFHTPCSSAGIAGMSAVSAEINVYPIPASNAITIDFPKAAGGSLQEAVIEITNIQGQTILQQPIQQGKTNIYIGTLAKGVYILRLLSNDKTEVTRIVKE